MKNFFKRYIINRYTIFIWLIIIGLILILVGQIPVYAFGISINLYISNVGAFTVAAAFMSGAYEFILREQFMDEVRGSVIGGINLNHSKIIDFCKNSKEIKFDNHIENAKKITIMFNFSPRFLNDYYESVEQFLRNGGELNFILLKRDGKAVEALKEFGHDNANVEANYNKVDDALGELSKCGKINVIYVDSILKYACVIIDHKGFFIFSTSSVGRKTVPILTFSKGGEFWNFVNSDLEKVSAQ